VVAAEEQGRSDPIQAAPTAVLEVVVFLIQLQVPLFITEQEGVGQDMGRASEVLELVIQALEALAAVAAALEGVEVEEQTQQGTEVAEVAEVLVEELTEQMLFLDVLSSPILKE
jgi:hypothetical protein